MEARIMKSRWGSSEIRLIKTWVPNETGDLAIRFATHFGIIAAKSAGEDTAGRSRLDLQTVDEIVDRSCELADKLVAKMKEKGWIVDLPDLPEEEPEKDNPSEQGPVVEGGS